MYWENKNEIVIPRYSWTSTNQYGDRYERVYPNNNIPVLRLSVQACSATQEELKRLILLGNYLRKPVKYAFTEPQHTISIDIVSADLLKESL